VDDEPVVDRCVGADDDVVGADHVSIARGYPRGNAVHDFFGVHARINLSAIAENRAREALQIFERMEGRLAREAQRDARIPEVERRTLDELGIAEPGAMGGFELALEILTFCISAKEQVAVHALEVAVDVFHRGDGFDPLNRCGVTFRGRARALPPVKSLDVEVPVVQRSGEVRGRAPCLSASDRAVIDEHHRASSPGEEIGGSHTGDPRPDYADIDAQVLSK